MKVSDTLGVLEPDQIKRLLRSLDQKRPRRDEVDSQGQMSARHSAPLDDGTSALSSESGVESRQEPAPLPDKASSGESLDPRKIRPEEEERIAELY